MAPKASPKIVMRREGAGSSGGDRCKTRINTMSNQNQNESQIQGPPPATLLNPTHTNVMHTMSKH
jgi:hypothetical protein